MGPETPISSFANQIRLSAKCGNCLPCGGQHCPPDGRRWPPHTPAAWCHQRLQRRYEDMLPRSFKREFGFRRCTTISSSHIAASCDDITLVVVVAVLSYMLAQCNLESLASMQANKDTFPAILGSIRKAKAHCRMRHDLSNVVFMVAREDFLVNPERRTHFANVRRTRPCHHFSSDIVHRTLVPAGRFQNAWTCFQDATCFCRFASVRPGRTFLLKTAYVG